MNERAAWDSVQAKEELESLIYKTVIRAFKDINDRKDDENMVGCKIELYEELIKEFSGWSYGKDVIFRNDDGTWYNRDTCKNQTT